MREEADHQPECPVCHIEISIDLEQEAIDVEEPSKKTKQGILSRLDLNVSPKVSRAKSLKH
jgi:DNA repair protein RAD16